MESPSEESKFLLEDFPIEVVESISKYLSVYDLNACGACNSKMREMFNDDLIWKKRCDRELADYLEKTPCKVKPTFSFLPLLEKTNHSLSPVSKWKVAFMRETHLWNNWRKGKYVKEDIKSNQSGTNSYCDFHTFLSNDFIIAVFENRFEVLDVRQSPFYLLAIVDCYGTRERGFKLNLWQNFIICSVGSAVQVFQLDTQTNECKLKHLFFFEDDDRVQMTNMTRSQVEVNIRSLQRTKPMLHVKLVGPVMVGVYQNQSIMHLWNLETGKKIKKVHPFIRNCLVTDIASSSTMNLVVCLSEKSNRSVKICGVYSLESLKYLEFQKEVHQDSKISVNQNCVAIWDRNTFGFDVFDYESSRQVMCGTPSSPPHVFRNGFIFNFGEGFEFANVSTGVIEKVNNEGKSVVWFEVLNNKFIQVKNPSYRNEVWELSDDLKTVKTTSLDIYFDMCAYFFNKCRTRYIVREEVGRVMHFW